MPEIIHKPKKVDPLFQDECGVCNVVVRFKSHEVRSFHGDKDDLYAWAKCPNCGVETLWKKIN